MTEATVEMDAPGRLRNQLVDGLIRSGSISSKSVETAFRKVPRHLFAPEVTLEAAYANDTVRIKRNHLGVTISSVSAPWLQAVMLEQAAINPGMRCLEIGSGGYNAALMAELVGPTGEVTTVDIDPEVTERARSCLARAGYEGVEVVLGDGEYGVVERAPYDRIIVTVGVWDIPPAWLEQLADRGRLVVPLRLRGLGRSVSLDREGDHLVSRGHVMAGFVDVQGVGANTEHLVPLDGDQVGLRFDDLFDVDADALRSALRQPRALSWSGVRFGEMEPFDGLFLWLATCVSEFCLLSRARTEAARRLVDPASPIGTPTLLGEDSFAYLTFRQVDADSRIYEFGACAHGPQADQVAEQLNQHVRAWDRNHRHGPGALISIYPADTPAHQLPKGRIIGRRHTKIVISWP